MASIAPERTQPAPITSQRIAAIRSDLSHALLTLPEPERQTVYRAYQAICQIEQELGPIADTMAAGDEKRAHLQLVKQMHAQKRQVVL